FCVPFLFLFSYFSFFLFLLLLFFSFMFFLLLSFLFLFFFFHFFLISGFHFFRLFNPFPCFFIKISCNIFSSIPFIIYFYWHQFIVFYFRILKSNAFFT